MQENGAEIDFEYSRKAEKAGNRLLALVAWNQI
jgi:hypothetical protein